ncbi:hypothetical protein J2Z60_001653 [Lactobacillus colini]|uniref:Apiosidase-like catalytic domain-containing protein n=1 Tax=Lactobacillus colini TaxID=1819254 RepID=A0ABS4MFU8_9LACO|nr:DUF4038 domain-containing protein [Lactobacillus colini]MBP2058468.1 hypothetical protein [Lactobacillus colini]
MLEAKGRYLYKDGKRFFYLADTCWSAFTSIEMPDWRYYLDTRKFQGYNAVQINILRQWDSSLPIKGREPFAIVEHEDGSYEYDYTKINEAYFDNAEKMLAEMIKRNMVPVLVLLWGNFVPGTWMSNFTKNNVMPFEQIKPYVEYVVKRFKKYDPIWFVTGDVGFAEKEGQEIEEPTRYYREVLQSAKSVDPDGIYTFHINGESHELPEDFLKQASFFIYQSGHGKNGQATAYTIPQLMRKNGYTGPMMDAEICYEGFTKMTPPQEKSTEVERYTSYDVRKAAWKAVLSGADMGIGYGCFGIWPWNDTAHPEQKLGMNFNVEIVPYDWRQCLQLPGASDMGILKELVMEYGAQGLEPIASPSKNNPAIRAAQNDEYLLVYLPTAGIFDFKEIGINPDNVKIIDLDKRHVLTGKLVDGVLQMMPVREDSLLIVKK